MLSQANQKKKLDRILPGISAFAWSPDNSRCAVCPQGREILIFKTNGKPSIAEWDLEAVHKEVCNIEAPKISWETF